MIRLVAEIYQNSPEKQDWKQTRSDPVFEKTLTWYCLKAGSDSGKREHREP